MIMMMMMIMHCSDDARMCKNLFHQTYKLASRQCGMVNAPRGYQAFLRHAVIHGTRAVRV